MLSKLKSMEPRDFENMSYDLLMLLSIRNLIWRTPGSDGGRDLEGTFLSTDFSGGLNSEKWYFECKRYASSISWPTVFEKISYAANQNADYLLFLSTSSFSPNCEDEVLNWNSRGRRPRVRQWPGHYLVELVSSNSKLLVKYKLIDITDPVPPSSMLNLATDLAKAVQSAYAAEEFQDAARSQTVFAASLADFLTSRLTGNEHPAQKMEHPFRIDQDGFEWLSTEGSPEADRYTLRAIITALRLKFPKEQFRIIFSHDALKISTANGRAMNGFPHGIIATVNEICFWSNLEPFFEKEFLELRKQRK